MKEIIESTLKEWGIEKYVILEKPKFDMVDGILTYPNETDFKIHIINNGLRPISNNNSLETQTYLIKDGSNGEKFSAFIKNYVGDKIMYVYSIKDNKIRFLI